MRVRIAGISASLVVLASFALSGQSLPRTPWGDPDLEGVGTTEMLRDARVPYERPKSFGTRMYLSDAEFAERQARAVKAGFKNDSMTFRQTSLIVDPADGRYPALTPEAQRRPQVMTSGPTVKAPSTARWT